MAGRLLILTPTQDRGGAEEYLLRLASAAAERGWEAVVGAELTPGTRTLAQELRSHPSAHYVNAPIRDWHRGGATTQLFVTLWLLARIRPDVVMVVLPWPTRGTGCVIAPALAGVPAIIVFQLAPHPITDRPWKRRLRWARRRRQQWISVSDQNREAVEATFSLPAGAVRTIYNGAPELVRRAPDQLARARRDLRAELGIPADGRIVLTIGRLSEQKGYADLLQIIPGVLEGRPDLFFVWAGDGELRRELDCRIREGGLEPHVQILGHRGDTARLLAGADIFLLPSRYEGQSFALTEALAHGVPALSSDAGGAAEIIRNGIDGLIFGRADPAALAQKLIWALDHPQRMSEMADAGRARAALFSEERMVAETFAVIDSLRKR